MRWLLTMLLTGLVLAGSVGCRADAVDAMSRTTALVVEQFAPEYEQALEDCVSSSSNWTEYDACAAPWNAAADAVRALKNTTLTLDGTQGRRALKSAACRWFEAASVVDAVSPVDIPAVRAALDSKWRRRC